jgi:hypothetical protein
MTKSECQGTYARNSATILRCALLTILLTCLASCNSLEGKFTESVTADLGTFADQTIAMMRAPDLEMREDDMVLTREYINPLHSSVVRNIEISRRKQLLLDALVQYSLNIANFDLTSSSDEERIATFAEYVASFRIRMIENVGLPEEDFSHVVEDIRQQTVFLNAVQAAQPIANTVGSFGQQLIGEYETTIDEIALHMDGAIEQEYASLRSYEASLEEDRNEMLISLGALYQREMTNNQDLSDEELKLVASLKDIEELYQELSPRRKLYFDTHRELDQLYADALDDAMRIRLTLLVWTRAHERMASGTVDSADWFSYKDIGVAALKVGRRYFR